MSGKRALIALQSVAAVGICAWWVYWFASGSNTHGSSCSLAYENSFPLADLVLAGSLAATAWALHRRHPAVLVLGGLAAGMAFSLATLDTTHNVLTGGFSGPLGTTLREALFAGVNGLVGVWTLVWMRRNVREAPSPPSWMGVPATFVAITSITAVLVASASSDGCGGVLTGAALGWAALVVVVLAWARTMPSAVLVGALVHGLLVALVGRLG